MSGSVEIIVLLELMAVVAKGGRNINRGKIVIGVDCKRMCKKIIKEINKSNEYAQESGAEIAMIKQIMKQLNFEVEIKLMKGYEIGIMRYENELVKWLTRQCDEEAEKAREDAKKMNRLSNLKHFGRCSIKRDSVVQMRSIKEMVRVIDAK